MSTTPDYLENVPDANKGTAQSLAAPSGAGVGGTLQDAASAEVGQVEGTIPLERCREAFLSFYCEHPQGRGLLRRYWNGYGFESAKAQKHWGIWLAACGFAAAHVNAAWGQGA